MTPNRPALALLLVGLVLLPGPAYAVGLERIDAHDRGRSPTGYAAPQIDAANDSVLAAEYGSEVAFDASDLRYDHVAAEYRAPSGTRGVLAAAIEDGSARTDDPGVTRDLRRIDREHGFVTRDHDAYYELTLVEEGSELRVEVSRATDAELAAAVRDRLVVEYDSLPRAERATFDEIRNATRSPDRSSYRPWSDEPVPEPPVIVAKDGRHYEVVARVHVDDVAFPDGLVAGIAASGLGLVCLLGAGALRLRVYVGSPK